MITSAQTELSGDCWITPLPLHAAAMDDPTTGLIVLDRALKIVHATGQVPRLLGVTATSVSEISAVRDLFASSTPESAAQGEACVRGEEFEPVLLKIQGSQRSIRMRVRRIGSGHRLACFEDASDWTGQESGGSQYGTSDLLTGLASRNKFESCVSEQICRLPDQPFAIFLLDLDRFKPVNDTLGHPTGDAVLRLVAKRLKGALRDDDLVARLGGDEFAVMSCQAKTVDEISLIASRILEVVQRTYLVQGHLVNIGVSIGIAMAPVHGTTSADLLKHADLALYHSKSAGRATFSFFDLKMAAQATQRRANELELRRALALRQLEVHYQPQIQIDTGKLVGFEALVRWRHPERGLIPPNDFLPLAEEIGIIVPLGEWVLRTACRQALQWEDHVAIAVNASPLQFDKGDFAETVRRVLQSTGLPGRRLEIEITEGILLRDEDAILATLDELRQMEVRIAMDDFGTGYASLSQLARFPFDKIKIDRSLAGMDGSHPKNRAIVRAIAALGASLGVCTMAEGVEDEEQLERLRVDGCSSVQGYFFGRPIPAADLSALIAKLEQQETLPKGKVQII